MNIRGESGFTLTEMLVSLVIFSLSMAVIWQGAGLVSRLNSQINKQKAEIIRVQTIATDLNARLSPLQPITDAQLTGHANRLEFQCEPGALSQNCSYNVSLGHLVYISDGVRYNDWPPVTPGGADEPVRLTAVALANDRGKSLAIITFPVEHAADCQFDMISRTCRSESAISEAMP